MFYNDAKEAVLAHAKSAEKDYNDLGAVANKLALSLYERRKEAARAISRVEHYVNNLAHSPKEFCKDVAAVVLSISDFRKAMAVEAQGDAANITGASVAVGGTAVGGAIVTLGPTVAMAIATTFGTASTGTAIASLTGAAATNAALAWLGGGALAAGGGGMAAGNAFLALAGPVGWTIGGVLVVGGALWASSKNKEAAAKANQYATEVRSKLAELKPKVAELQNLCHSTPTLAKAISVTPFCSYPQDYCQFSSMQKQALAALINNTKALGALLNERIA